MKVFYKLLFLFVLFLFLIFGSCKQDRSSSDKSNSKTTESQISSSEPISQEIKLFKKLSASESGINVINEIRENDVLNYFSYEYVYNGGGVAIGDLNNDDLPDLFFTVNMHHNKLYLNNGNLQFQDISNQAGINDTRGDWCTGVTMVDINNDGWLDIYVSRSGWFDNPDQRRNLLYINNGDLTFTEQAASYGIDDPGYSTQATFFDFDRDNDLDLYVGNHPIDFKGILLEGMARRKNPPQYQSDQLYRNDGGKFTNISKQAGISNYGHTLGVVTSDLDNDGWTDIFVSNDYIEPNYYYRNQGDGTFENISPKMFKHSSRFSMGADIADINNDGLYDIYTTEMMAEDNQRQKTNMASMSTELFWTLIKENYEYQYMHNCLQLNQGNAPFSEIAYLAGVATTDWSWSPLLADFDNDGYKDIFVTNGYKRDVLDKDFLKKGYEVKQDGKSFSEVKNFIPMTKLSNYIYKNNQDLTFNKQTKAWGFSDAMNTNGASYSDLDNDGDLDLVLSNLDEPSVIYQNQLMEINKDNNNYLKIKCEGPSNNKNGLGVRVSIKYGDQEQHHELLGSRGYLSSVEPILHFGLSDVITLDEVKILWPDMREQIIKDVKTGQTLSVKYEESKKGRNNKVKASSVFASANIYLNGIRPHKEKVFDDYSKQLLLPHKQSQFGPSIAVGDLNGDEMDDFFLGGAAGQSGVIAFQQKDGSFLPQKSSALEQDRRAEDMGSLLFDADGDGDLDLYVVNGSYEFQEKDQLLQDRLYLNDGKGTLVNNTSALPTFLSNGSCVIAGDYDNDNDLDLFVGGLTKHGKYPLADDSYILKNEGGQFKIANEEVFYEPINGLVKSALWTDYDNDKDLDLIVTGEWMPIKVYNNVNGKLKEVSKKLGLNKSLGWWNSISSGDFDNDGDIDYILGNLGLNSKNKASNHSPFTIYANDFDNNNTFDVALGFYEKGVCYPLRGMQCSSEQVPSIANKIPDYASFAISSIEDVYGTRELSSAIKFEAYQFASCYMENKGDDGFVLNPLPNEAQVAPSFGTLIQDFDRDGCLDVLLVGNQFPIEIETTRQDAHRGVLLKGNCDNKFEAVSVSETGLLIEGDAKAMAWLSHDKSKKPFLIITQNDDKVAGYSLNGLDLNRGFQLEVPELENATLNSCGGGYLSQSSKQIWGYKK